MFLYPLDDDKYTEWSNWTFCSVTCGDGTQSRSRYCQNMMSPNCSNPMVQTKECSMPLCPSKSPVISATIAYYESCAVCCHDSIWVTLHGDK